MKPVIINLAAFKLAWTATVLSAAAGVSVIGAIAVAIAAGIHLKSTDNPGAESRLLVVAAVMGLVWESLLVSAGLVQYTTGSWLPGMAPYWIVTMWVLFATTLNAGMRWLHRNTAIAAVAGALGGPMAFAAGAAAGAVEFPSATASLVVIGIGWAILLPLLVRIAQRLEAEPRRTLGRNMPAMKRVALATSVIAVSIVLTALNPASADNRRADWDFEVYLNDKPIGFHTFSVTGDQDQQVLRTEAQFDVKFLFINAFRYRHDNTETWRDGCLQSIEATTDNNGDFLSVRGERNGDALQLTAQSGRRAVDDCVQTFAYWNPDILGASRLLNSQTGELEDVSVTMESSDVIDVNGDTVEAIRYRLFSKSGAITLWYSNDESRRWLALEAPAKGGRTLRYVPVKIPAADDLVA